MAASPIDSVPGKLGGFHCFAGTRVTIDMLFLHLEGGGTVDSFVKDYTHIPREQVVAVLDRAREVMIDERALPLVLECGELSQESARSDGVEL